MENKLKLLIYIFFHKLSKYHCKYNLEICNDMTGIIAAIQASRIYFKNTPFEYWVHMINKGAYFTSMHLDASGYMQES